MILRGDCIEKMAEMDEASVDAIVCDPPYGLEFMGKEWDRLGASATHRADREAELGEENKRRYIASGVTYGQNVRAMQEWHLAWATEALRVLKPGGHLLAFGGSRTFHRLTCAVEDAGFEIRDSLIWIYGSGFPKSLDVSKAIDKAAGVEREPGAPGRYSSRRPREEVEAVRTYHDGVGDAGSALVTTPATPEAAQWEGWAPPSSPPTSPSSSPVSHSQAP